MAKEMVCEFIKLIFEPTATLKYQIYFANVFHHIKI